MQKRKCLVPAHILAAVVVAGTTRYALATNDNWIGLSGNWSIPGNWTAGLPTTSTSAIIYATGTGSSVVTYDYNYTPYIDSLVIVKFNGNSFINHNFTLDMETSGTLSTISDVIGSGGSAITGPNGTGSFVQNAGTHNVNLSIYLGGVDYAPTGGNAAGFYSLGGTGVLTAANLICGGTGTGVFTQTGGTATISNVIIGGLAGVGVGTLSINAGVFNAGALFFANNPANAFNLSGGTVTANSVTFNSATAQFNWSGGTLILTGDQTLSSPQGTSWTVAANCRLNIAGNETIAPGFTLNLNTGGTNTSGNLVSVSGTLNANGGNLIAPSVMLTGGTINGALANTTTFFYVSGSFAGRLVNFGTASFSPSSMTLGNGVENDGVLTVVAGQTLIVNGVGMDNNSTFTLVQNATINGAGPVINDYGGVFTSSGLINTTLTNFGKFVVAGVTTLAGGATNQGLFQGSGTVIGALTNAAGGIIEPNNASGNPLAFATFSGNAAGASISINANQSVAFSTAWTNDGLVELHSATAILNGKTITNTGTIQGLGSISAPVTNNGVLRSSGGELDLAGAGSVNGPTGQIQADSGSSMVILSGISANSGFIVLAGGTFDNNNKNMTNTGVIEGSGTFRAGTLTNSASGVLTLADKDSFIYGSVVSSGNIKIVANTTTFFGVVTNTGTIQVTSGVARFLGNGVSMTLGGQYISDPSDNYFNALTVTSSGNLTGSAQDRFYVTTGPLINAGAWKLDGSLTAGTIVNSGTLTQNGTLIASGNFTNTGIATIAGPQTWSAGATFTNSSGGATFLSDPGATNTRTLTLSISGGSVKLVGPQHLQAVSISAGKLDVQGDVFLASGSYASLAPSLHSQAITTTLNSPGAAVALLTGAEFLALNPAGLRHGQQVLPSDILLTPAYAGDTNLDGIISIDDYLSIDAAFARHVSNPHWVNGDINYDGTINAVDYALIDLAFQHQSGPLADGMVSLHTAQFGQPYIDALAALDDSPSTIPEPATLLLMFAALLPTTKRRHSGHHRNG